VKELHASIIQNAYSFDWQVDWYDTSIMTQNSFMEVAQMVEIAKIVLNECLLCVAHMFICWVLIF